MTDPKKDAPAPGKVVEGTATLTAKTTTELPKATEPSKPIPEEAPEKPLTKEQEKAIDAALGDAPEVSFSDDETLDIKVEDPAATRNALVEAAELALKKFHKLNNAIPNTTPDEHFIWGIADARLTVGDLRALMKVLPPR